MAAEPPLQEGVQLQENQRLYDWIVLKKLGEGGFGAVYEVKNQAGERYAMKTELAEAKVRVLKLEVYVLRELKKIGSKHFCDIVDSARVGQINYIVMTLVGRSLHDLRKAIVDPQKQKFSLGCALSTGIQCVEAIHEIHRAGYLHRDIKPGNFAVGKNDVRKVYLLDFGMARRYTEANGKVRPPRWYASMRGTVRYAPLSCHVNREQCRKDDLESWMYTQIEITKGYLPWKTVVDRDEIGRYKERSRNAAFKELFGGCPREFVDILVYVDTLRYYDEPDYARVQQLMRSALVANNVREFPYDWESAAFPA
ncbi:CK1/WORM6 protein kinase [Aphelenchoides avenae]|nr:CK1/WORM6 protein kinase [Aphelenchus avenae]